MLISLQLAPIMLHRKVSWYLYFVFYILETLSKLSLHSTLNRFFELLNVRLSNFRGDLFFRPGTHHSIQDSAESRISVGEEGAIAGIDGRVAKVDDQRDDDDTLRKMLTKISLLTFFKCEFINSSKIELSLVCLD